MHSVSQFPPSKNLPTSQEVHSELKGPVHSPHVVWQGSQVDAPVFTYCPEGHPLTQLVTDRLKGFVQLRHSVFAGPLQVVHSVWQFEHVFRVAFS